MNLYISDIVKDMDEQIINEMFSNFESESMSDERIRTMVFENINGKANDKSGKKRLSPKKIIVIAIAAALGLGGVAGATYLGQKNLRKNEVLSEENQRFVGTEVQGEYRPPAKMGDAPPTWEEIQKEMEERVRSQTDIIEDHSEFFGGMIPSGATEIIIEKRGENAYVYPEQILVNGAVSILKREEKAGWNLDAGDKVEITFLKYPSEVQERQSLMIGWIKDGKLEEGYILEEMNGKCEFEVTESGEYYFYFMNWSSEYLTLHEGEIILETHR